MLSGVGLVPGVAEGEIALSAEAVGVARIDPLTGVLHEPGHPLDGCSLAGKVLACPGGKGSSGGSFVLLNLAQRGLAPAALVVERPEAVMIAGAVLAGIPLVQRDPRWKLCSGERVRVEGIAGGTRMALTQAQQGMLEGRGGRALQLAMRILVAVGDACGADKLIPVASAHVGMSLSSFGEAGVHLFESLAAEGAHFAVRTTTNVLSFARGDQASPDARLQRRALDAMKALGALDNCSCNPFLQGHAPHRGEAVAWSESATAPYINSVLGARTNREGATALASALTGLTPRYGLHLDGARAGGPLYRVTARLDGLHRWHLLAAAVLRRSAGGVPVLQGVSGPVSQDLLYGFSAAFASYSAGAMFHIVGLTPEAPSLQALYGERIPSAAEIGDAELEAEQARWETFTAPPDYVVIGCPHASLGQLQEVASLLGTAPLRPGVAFFVHTNVDVLQAARAAGVLEALESAGIRVTADTCVYVSLQRLPAGARLLTDSAKMALLMGSRGLHAAVASTTDCVHAAASPA